MIEFMGAVATVMAVAGVILNNRKRIACFYFWIVSNSLCMLIHWQTGLISLTVRDGIFVLLALEGIWQWGEKEGGAFSVRRKREGGAFGVEQKQAETIKRLKQDNDALEAMLAAFEKAPRRHTKEHEGK